METGKPCDRKTIESAVKKCVGFLIKIAYQTRDKSFTESHHVDGVITESHRVEAWVGLM